MTSVNLFADSVSIVRNGQSAFMRSVNVPFSNLILNFFNVLKDEGYVGDVTIKEVRRNIRIIAIQLKYYKSKVVISDMRIISKPSRRVFWSVDKFKDFYSGLGMFVLSTPNGVLPVYKAQKLNVGGEVLCAVF